MVSLRTEVPGNGSVGPYRPEVGPRSPLSPAVHIARRQCAHTQDQGVMGDSRLRMTRQQHHRTTTGCDKRPPCIQQQHESSDRQSPVSLRRSAAGFPIVNGRVGVSHWVEDWRPRACSVVVDGPVRLGPGRGREGDTTTTRSRILLRFFIFQAGEVCELQLAWWNVPLLGVPHRGRASHPSWHPWQAAGSPLHCNQGRPSMSMSGPNQSAAIDCWGRRTWTKQQRRQEASSSTTSLHCTGLRLASMVVPT